MFAKQTIQQEQNNTDLVQPIQVIKAFVEKNYPSLIHLITEPQYEQLAWIDYKRCTNQALLIAEQKPQADLPFQTKRIIARLYFLTLFRSNDSEAAHAQLTEGQTGKALDFTNFETLANLIKNLTEAEYQQLWVACLTSVCDIAKELAAQNLTGPVPADSVEFLAKVMSEQADLYPAAKEVMQQDETAREGFKIIFSSGHLRHMLDVEGDLKTFSKLVENKLNATQLNLWFAYWLMDITALSIHTKNSLGSEFLKNDVAKTLLVLKRHLDEFIENPNKPVLRAYLEERAGMLGLQSTDSNLFSLDAIAPELILTRIAAMFRLFSAEFSPAICAGLKELKETLKPEEYKKMFVLFNPIQKATWPTPTYTPALLTNLLKKTDSHHRAVVLGLPLIVRALEVYKELFMAKKISIPLNFNSLASKVNIERIASGEIFDISVDCEEGDVLASELKPVSSQTMNTNFS